MRAILVNYDQWKGGFRHTLVSAASMASPLRPREPSEDFLVQVASARDDWLAHGLSTDPSDRPAAERAVTQLYRTVGCREPTFRWVPSPAAAASYIENMGLTSTLSGDGIHRPPARIAGYLSRSRSRMDRRIGQDRHSPVRVAVWDSLRTSLFDAVASAVRTTVPGSSGSVPWYGQQEAHRVAYYDVHRALGLARYSRRDEDLLDVLIEITMSTGWWWAYDEVCVMAERPRVTGTEPTPDGVHGEIRLHMQDSPAVEFVDGTVVYALHGTVVPEWVVCDPTVERIAEERNVEVRRSAIERIGWDTYIDAAGLELLDCADDPGNAGHALALYATPSGWGVPGRILLVTNGSQERDGTRRRYGLNVPEFLPSALDAAGWTYGISGRDYARLVRRT